MNGYCEPDFAAQLLNELNKCKKIFFIFFKKELETFISTSRSVILHHWALDWYWWGQTRANEARQQQKRTHLLFDAVK